MDSEILQKEAQLKKSLWTTNGDKGVLRTDKVK